MAAASLCEQIQRLANEGRTEEAAEALRNVASRASPQDAARLYMSLAELEQARGRSPQAASAWEAVLRLDPNCMVAWKGLQTNAAACGDQEAQMLALQTLCKKEPDNADWLVRLGELQIKKGAREEATRNLHQALQIAPRHTAALLALARSSSGDDSMWLFEKAALAEPTSTEALEGAAAARWSKGDYAVAGQWYRALLNQKPEHGLALCRMAELLLQEGNVQEALMLLTRATRREPHPPEALLWLGYTHLVSGHAERAVAPLQAVLRQAQSPLHTQAQLHWALVLVEMNDATSAEEQFSQAARSLPSVTRWCAEVQAKADKELLKDRLGVFFSKDLPGASQKMLGNLEALLRQYEQRGALSKEASTPHMTPALSMGKEAAADNWRADLKEGQRVEVYSKSGKRWIPGSVMQLSADMVKIKYLIDGHWCEKVLLRESEFLRLSQEGTMSASLSTSESKSQDGQQARNRGPPRSGGADATPCGSPAASPGLACSSSTGASGACTPRGGVAAPMSGSPGEQRSPSMPRVRATTPQRTSAAEGTTPRGVSPVRAGAPPPKADAASQRQWAVSGHSSASNAPAAKGDPAGDRQARQHTPVRVRDGIPSHAAEQQGSSSSRTAAVSPMQRTPPPQQEQPRAAQQRLPELLDPKNLQFGTLLGNGGFGAVYRGSYAGEEVAIKKMHLTDGKVSDTQVEEFKKEVRNLQALRHPRLVRFIGAAYMAPTLCIITEFMPNGSLYALLHKRKEFISFDKQRGISRQLCEGVAFLHSQRPPFVHRDLKSLNVVLDYELNAKLCDFGLTQSMEKTHITRRENEGGSPRYMAPELFDSKGKITEKVDIWALGCLILEVFSSEMPHEECSSVQQVMMKLLVQGELPFSRWDMLPEQLHAIVELCFAFNPRQRTDAAQLLQVICGL